MSAPDVTSINATGNAIFFMASPWRFPRASARSAGAEITSAATVRHQVRVTTSTLDRNCPGDGVVFPPLLWTQSGTVLFFHQFNRPQSRGHCCLSTTSPTAQSRTLLFFHHFTARTVGDTVVFPRSPPRQRSEK